MCQVNCHWPWRQLWSDQSFTQHNQASRSTTRSGLGQKNFQWPMQDPNWALPGRRSAGKTRSRRTKAEPFDCFIEPNAQIQQLRRFWRLEGNRRHSWMDSSVCDEKTATEARTGCTQQEERGSLDDAISISVGSGILVDFEGRWIVWWLSWSCMKLAYVSERRFISFYSMRIPVRYPGC